MASDLYSNLNVVFAVSEFDGIVKTGGLADAAGALAPVMEAAGHRVKVIMPAYRAALSKVETVSIAGGCVRMNHGETLWFGIRHGQFRGTDVYFVEYDEFFDRGGIYGEGGQGYHDNSRRFAFFSKAVLETCRILDFKPDVVHCHDWQAALLPYYLRVDECSNPFFADTRSLLTIHNAAYQQKTDVSQIDSLGIAWRYFNPACFEDFGMINILKGGIAFADKINTVSPQYARELLTPLGSHGLMDSFKRRETDLSGILNGCDYTQWSPETDTLIPARFSRADRAGKKECKTALQHRMGLPVDHHKPVYGLVSRLAGQKGFDYLIPALWRFLHNDVQLVLLGSGEPHTAAALEELAQAFPDKCRFYNGFENQLAHWIEAGSDFFLMPSLFEPCGLNQIYSLKYGTLPIVRRVGGLSDTVAGFAEHNDKGTGFVFNSTDPQELFDCLQTSLDVYYQHELFTRLQDNAMSKRFTWEQAADAYCSVYHSLR
ncbi:glycogen synthase GlgA [Endozoicomonas euniceicola]|uniref:Glycogen synthase n=1 Tax=Endozoicomonas euniceicola TaxID=1234143 RepID=A0ABY6GZ31_9GAMM|nr:glycogen synthase GlgA [Endozoicomonas euniceicola]UYM17306.1 glycogen synthase GlgA [Endozoicomonas euniceicola]